jgi:hypothetical protein
MKLAVFRASCPLVTLPRVCYVVKRSVFSTTVSDCARKGEICDMEAWAFGKINAAKLLYCLSTRSVFACCLFGMTACANTGDIRRCLGPTTILDTRTIVIDVEHGKAWRICQPDWRTVVCRRDSRGPMYIDQVQAYSAANSRDSWRLPSLEEVAESFETDSRRRNLVWGIKGFYWIRPPVAGSNGYAWYVYQPGNRLAEFGNYQFAAYLRLIRECRFANDVNGRQRAKESRAN